MLANVSGMGDVSAANRASSACAPSRSIVSQMPRLTCGRTPDRAIYPIPASSSSCHA